jgi:hypothetical protein
LTATRRKELARPTPPPGTWRRTRLKPGRRGLHHPRHSRLHLPGLRPRLRHQCQLGAVIVKEAGHRNTRDVRWSRSGRRAWDCRHRQKGVRHVAAGP